jgi:uracil-DNA glycosylase
MELRTTHAPLPPKWCGPLDAEVVFVGNELSDKPIPGGWLPFTSRLTTEFGRLFGDKAIQYAWTNVRDCSPFYLRNRKGIIACGNIAHVWVRNYIENKENKEHQIIYIPHPSYLLRFKNSKAKEDLKKTMDGLHKVLNF